MSITAAMIRRIASLDVPVEAMREMFLVLAEQWDQEERTRALAAERQSRYRNAHSNVTVASLLRDSDVIVTSRARVEDNSNLPKEVSKNPPIPPKPSKPLSSDPEGFVEFWAIFPKRAKDNDRKPAVKSFVAARKRVDLETLLRGARGYAEHVRKEKITFIKKARTWLNDENWTEFQPPEELQPAERKVPVIVDTPQWEAWKAVQKRIPIIDLHVGNQIKRGWYFPTEYPPHTQENAA